MTTVVIKKHADLVGDTDKTDDLLAVVNDLASFFDEAGLGLGVEITVNLPSASRNSNGGTNEISPETKPRNVPT